jgi:site-specific recombinase XerD
VPLNVSAAVELPRVKNALSEKFLTEAEAHRIVNAPKSPRDRTLLSMLYA